MLPRWGVCATVRAPVAQVLAFSAHHLDLGASRVWLHFDDPNDPAADACARHRQITVVRCDEAYWNRVAQNRPAAIELRQMRNATRVYRRTDLAFVAHLDVDEFLLADVPVAELLAGLAPERLVLRAEPFEALHDPELPDDIFTARAFRRAMRDPDAAVSQQLYGRFSALLQNNMLSHTVGKCFFRTGVPGLVVHIHGAKIAGKRVFGGQFLPQLALLHFHAEDPTRWGGALESRLLVGAYRFLPDLQKYLADADPAGVAAFYEAVQLARPDLIANLQELGLLREVVLGLRAKVATVFGPGALEGDQTLRPQP